MTTTQPPEPAEQLFLTHLSLIEQVAARACRRKHLPADDVEDFVADVKLKLIEGRYAVLRRFEARGNCSFKTYLVVLVSHALNDHFDRLLGKRRPSAAAKKLGHAAEEYEKLRLHDHLTEDQAVATLRSRGLDLDEKTRLELEVGLASRTPPRLRADEEVLAQVAAPNGRGDEHLLAEERAQTRRRVLVALRELRRELSAEEQAYLRFRFDDDWTIAEISRRCHCKQKPLYRRFEEILARLYKRLEEKGFKKDDVDAVFGVDDLEPEDGDDAG